MKRERVRIPKTAIRYFSKLYHMDRGLMNDFLYWIAHRDLFPYCACHLPASRDDAKDEEGRLFSELEGDMDEDGRIETKIDVSSRTSFAVNYETGLILKKHGFFAYKLYWTFTTYSNQDNYCFATIYEIQDARGDPQLGKIYGNYDNQVKVYYFIHCDKAVANSTDSEAEYI